METKEYLKTTISLENLALQIGGYIQSSNVPRNPDGEKYSGLSARYLFMIPTAKIEEFLNSTGELGSVTNVTRNVENVTDSYLDAEVRIRNLTLKEERLLELLKESAELKDLLEIENSISNTRYEIERYQSVLKSYDKRIAYTEISVQVDEVYIYTPKSEKQTIWGRISSEFSRELDSFKSTVESIFVFVVSSLPFILIRLCLLGIPAYLGFFLYKKVKKRMKHKETTEKDKTKKE